MDYAKAKGISLNALIIQAVEEKMEKDSKKR